MLIGVGVAVLFFYLQKDLGPALVFACVFLTLYAIARNRVPLAVTGLAALFGGFLTGYFLGVPKTVHDRVAMWLSPSGATPCTAAIRWRIRFGQWLRAARWVQDPGWANPT